VLDGEVSTDGDPTSTARGVAESYDLQDLRARPPSLRRALRAAVLEGLPAYLHVLACVPVFDDAPNSSLPPRWQYGAVRKAFFLFYEPVGVAPGSSKQEGGHTPGQPFRLQSLFQSVFMSESDAAWFGTLRANKGSSTMNDPRVGEALEQYHTFLKDQLCVFLVRGDYNRLVQLLLLLLPEVPALERSGLLQDLRTCINSDAAIAGHLAYECAVMKRAILAVVDGNVPPSKLAFAREVLLQQSRRCADRLHEFCARAQWADVSPLKRHMLALMAATSDKHGKAILEPDSARRLGSLHQCLATIRQELSDTLAACCPALTTYLQRTWSQRKHVQLPAYLRPLSVRVKVIEVANEIERQRKAHTYSSNVVHESVLLQYAVDTLLDQTLQQLFQDVCALRLLKGNPLHAAILRVKAAAQYFTHWRRPDVALRAAVLNRPFVVDAMIQIARIPAPANAAQAGDTSGHAESGIELSDSDQCIFGVHSALLLVDHRCAALSVRLLKCSVSVSHASQADASTSCTSR